MAKVGVQFFFGGEKHAMKLWAAVPAVGDEVMLYASRDATEKTAFVVARRVFGVEGPDDHRQWVNVEIDLAKERDDG